jgi:enolase
VECELWLDDGNQVITSVPSGVSKSKYEAVELRDNDPNRISGLGVLQAVNNVNTVISPQIIGKDPLNQTEIDQLLVNLDGTNNKSKLGANALLATSQAVLKAGAASQNLPLYSYLQQKYGMAAQIRIPACIYGLINGGDQGADNLDIQEFQIIPASHIPFPDSLAMAATLFKKLEEVLVSKGAIHSVGIVGGFAPNLYNNTDAFEIMIETIKATKYTFAQDLFFGVDMEAQAIYEAGKYILKDKSQPYSEKELIEYYHTMSQQFHVFYIEDPFREDDWESWKKITSELGETTVIAADNLLSTNLEKTKKAIAERACNAVIVKPNQVGTISEALEVVRTVKQAGWQLIFSHRSGETNDDIIADLSVGLGFDYVRFGPPNRGERMSKYNRLLQIYSEITPLTANP